MMTNFYSSVEAYSKVWQLYQLRISTVFFDFRVLQKSHTTTSKVILKNSFVKSFLIMGAERP